MTSTVKAQIAQAKIETIESLWPDLQWFMEYLLAEKDFYNAAKLSRKLDRAIDTLEEQKEIMRAEKTK
jgi:AmiR/NasT family two-component response regulator